MAAKVLKARQNVTLAALLCLALVAHRASASNESGWFELDLRADLSQWASALGLPADERGPLDTPGPSKLPNLLAYAMGLNPMQTGPGQLPILVPAEMLASPRGGAVAALDAGPGAAAFAYLYLRDPHTVGVQLSLEHSEDLKEWNPAAPLEDEVIQENQGLELRAALFPVGEVGRGFLRLRAEQVD